MDLVDVLAWGQQFLCNKLHIVQITRAVPTLLQGLLLSSTAANCSPFFKSNFSSSRVQNIVSKIAIHLQFSYAHKTLNDCEKIRGFEKGNGRWNGSGSEEAEAEMKMKTDVAAEVQEEVKSEWEKLYSKKKLN